MIRIGMIPNHTMFHNHESGIRRVVEAYTKYLPKFGFEVVDHKSPPFSLRAAHAGMTGEVVDVAHCHGLYFTGEYKAATWEWRANANVTASLRSAREITVPTRWVAEVIQRDMHRTPHIVPHGIDWEAWQHDLEHHGHVLWNKNRTGDVCDPNPVGRLARINPDVPFVTTFGPTYDFALQNIKVIGLQPHDTMKRWVQRSAVYLSTTKETFGIGVLEAMAAGVPVLGFAFGGNLDLVEHGVNGYLAQPNNYDDLADGLAYCLKHRDVLGRNGQDMAREYTWEAACEKVAQVYKLALEPRPATAGIVIPTYNYAEKVGRAIESAVNQTYPGLTSIVVVDDGSTDDGDTEKVVYSWSAKDTRIRYIRQNNAGVAIARNTGIGVSDTKYITCLDADDALDPEFLSACIQELEADESLGITYTGLQYIEPDGKTGLSNWPEGFDFDAQLKRRNQIPTACVFRKSMWTALGGYRQRYAPKGAGAEDAEFWLRAGAYGWGAKKVTDAGLFIYSWKSGRVSGDPEYREVDWLAWHPWANDEQHPFASQATPEKFSHPVRFYDEPMISVIIPVGPKHADTLLDSLDSLEAQTFRKWEAIVVWDSRKALPQYYRDAFPFVKWLTTEGEKGAGYARNRGVDVSAAPFVLFLDADDYLRPNALGSMYHAWINNESIIYSDYIEKTVINDPDKYRKEIEAHPTARIVHMDGHSFIVARQAAEYDCALAQKQPDRSSRQPYLWNLVTSLVPRNWHYEIGGFDEHMPSWEDWDYYIRMARAGKCFTRVAEELVVYNFTTGSRRHAGLQLKPQLLQYMESKYSDNGGSTMPCNCGGRNRPQPTNNPVMSQLSATTNTAADQAAEVQKMNDDDFSLVNYRSPNRGQHQVRGAATGRDYYYRKGGDRFLVHKDDIAAQPHLFVVESTAQTAAPAPAITQAQQPPPPPKPRYELTTEPTPAPEPEDEIPAMLGLPSTLGFGDVDSDIDAGDSPQEAPGRIMIDVFALPGVSKPVGEALLKMGVDSVEDIIALGVTGLVKVKGIGEAKARVIMDYARSLT